MAKVLVTCEFCNKEFETTQTEYNKFLKGKKKHICCSRICQNRLIGANHRGKNNHKYVERIEKECEYCGSTYVDYRGSSSRFCSRNCVDKNRTKKALVEVVCEYCGNTFTVLKGELNFFGKIKYCSKECRFKAKEKRIDKVCVICGKSFWVHQCYANERICCSKECNKKWQSEIYTQIPEVNKRLQSQGASAVLKMKKELTLPEQKVFDYLTDKNIKFVFQFSIGGILLADFFLPDYNCVLEVYGDYWHGNPLKYGNEKIQLNDMQNKQKNKDIRRYKIITGKYHYFFYSVWEFDVNNDIENCMDKFFKYINSKIRRESDIL